MDNLLMDMITILGIQLIPGFGLIFLLASGLSRRAKLERARIKRDRHYIKNIS